jgi:lysophospholipase L1-like esterase
MKTILCYGDSNTHGTKPIDFDMLETEFVPSHYRYAREKRWTGVLQRELGSEFLVIEEGLNSRTTVFGDPTEGLYRNGLVYLTPCLESHAPVDLVVLMLGTNDLKLKFSATAFDIAKGIGVLIDTIQKSGTGVDGNEPEILVLCPPPLGRLSYLEDPFGEEGIKKSKQLAANYKKISSLYGCHFMDTGIFIKTSDVDGIHYRPEVLEKLGKEVAKMVQKIFS